MQHSTGGEPVPLVAPSVTESYEILPGRLDTVLVIICDHAVNVLPPGYGTLGLPAEEFQRHIAYDIGAFEVAKRLSNALGAPAIGARFCRLLVDVNRGLDDPTLIMRISDGAVVPGNQRLDRSEREKRVRLYYEPYHQAIDALIEEGVAAGVPPVLLSIHSFTEFWNGERRPWDAAILWDRDYRFSVPLLEALRGDHNILVGENEPYNGRIAGDCMWQHGTRRGLAHTIVEVRQDLIRDCEGQTQWANRIATAVEGVLARPDLRESLHSVHYFGSHTDAEGPPPHPSVEGRSSECAESTRRS
ncbi:MAG: N-formylglutamate amidohydrolase [Hyphomicrobium sp.]